MDAEPLSKEIFLKAKSLGVEQIILQFSGGSDEGYLTVILMKDSLPYGNTEFNSEIDTWAWTVYRYSGAGEGSDYGDDITYNLTNLEATSMEWFMIRQDQEETPEVFKVKGLSQRELDAYANRTLAPEEMSKEVDRSGISADNDEVEIEVG